MRTAATMLRDYPGHVMAAAAVLWLMPSGLTLAALVAVAMTGAGLRTWATRSPATFGTVGIGAGAWLALAVVGAAALARRGPGLRPHPAGGPPGDHSSGGGRRARPGHP